LQSKKYDAPYASSESAPQPPAGISGGRLSGVRSGYLQSEPTFRIGQVTGESPAERRGRSRSQPACMLKAGPKDVPTDSVGVKSALRMDAPPPERTLDAPTLRGRRTFVEPPAPTPEVPRFGKKITPVPFPNPVAPAPTLEKTARRRIITPAVESHDVVSFDVHSPISSSVTDSLDASRRTGVRRSRSIPADLTHGPFGVGDGVSPKPPNPRPIKVYETKGLLTWM